MDLPNKYILIRKEVKHARMRVSEDGKIRVIVPYSFTDGDVYSLIEKKKKWVEKNERFFKGMSRIDLHRHQLLMYGNRYNYFYDESCGNKVVIDHQHRTIRSKKDLLSKKVQEQWYKEIAKSFLQHRIEELSKKLKFTYNKLYIRNQRKKWGNCSKEKNISLNWKLIKAPLFVIDYLIVHELVHTEIMNHSYKFWTVLKSYFPDYKDAVNWLDKYGNSL